jgi:histidinol-phosphate phosphatase family protein
MTQHPFVLLDRDGTIIVDCNYVANADQVELLSNAASGLRKLQELGLGLAVVTNQSAVGRGRLDRNVLEAIHRRMIALLAAEGIELAGIYVCPHTPADACTCRKPSTGLVELAARELGFDPQSCFVIGDKPCDIELGQRCGATTLLVRTGYGQQVAMAGTATPDHVVADLAGAAEVIQRLLRGREEYPCTPGGRRS